MALVLFIFGSMFGFIFAGVQFFLDHNSIGDLIESYLIFSIGMPVISIMLYEIFSAATLIIPKMSFGQVLNA